MHTTIKSSTPPLNSAIKEEAVGVNVPIESFVSDNSDRNLYYVHTVTMCNLILNTRISGFEIEKSMSFSVVGSGLLELSYITLCTIRMKT